MIQIIRYINFYRKILKTSILQLENIVPYIEIMENFLLQSVINTTNKWELILNSTMPLNSIINSRSNYSTP